MADPSHVPGSALSTATEYHDVSDEDIRHNQRASSELTDTEDNLSLGSLEEKPTLVNLRRTWSSRLSGPIDTLVEWLSLHIRFSRRRHASDNENLYHNEQYTLLRHHGSHGSHGNPIAGYPGRRWKTEVQHWFWQLMPSFVSQHFGHSTIKQAKPSETSYLNGLRGIAAVVVVLQHITELFYPENHGCYGDGGEGLEPDHYIQLPFLKLILMGSFSVTLFFVISGFALTYGPLRKIHAGNPEAAIASMPSSIFRRPIRLFLPILPLYMFSWILIQVWFVWDIGSGGPGAKQDNFFIEMWVGFKHWLLIDTSPYVIAYYFPQGWTLHDEHMGSLLVFLCCLAFARTKTAVRMLGTSIVAIWHFYVDQWTSFLFLGGMLLADLRLATADKPILKVQHQPVKKIVMIVLLVIGLFFGSWPYTGDVTQCVGFRHFAHITMPGMMQMRFWHSLAAVVTLFALEGLPGAQRVFNSPVILYLGEISYSLYLVHWIVGFSWGEAIASAVLNAGHDRFWACMASLAVTLTTGIWLADIFWRYSDMQSVKAARWLATKVGV